jgi:hypothetical protein
MRTLSVQSNLLIVPTLRVVTHSMTLCVIRVWRTLSGFAALKKRTDTTDLRTIDSPTGSMISQPASGVLSPKPVGASLLANGVDQRHHC